MRRILVIAAGAALLLPPAPAKAGPRQIDVVDNEYFYDEGFTPIGGEGVLWDWVDTAEPHDVRQDKRLFVSGPPHDGESPDYTRRFSAGRFHFYCSVHGSPTGGMDGWVRVAPLINDAPDGPAFSVRWAAASSNTGRAFDVRYSVDGSDWFRWRTDVTGFRGVFGRNGRPIVVTPGHTYRLQARTQATPDTPKRVSHWSPPTLYVT